jgi:hypothetical protein
MRNTEELQTIFKSLVHVALGAYRPLIVCMHIEIV